MGIKEDTSKVPDEAIFMNSAGSLLSATKDKTVSGDANQYVVEIHDPKIIAFEELTKASIHDKDESNLIEWFSDLTINPSTACTPDEPSKEKAHETDSVVEFKERGPTRTGKSNSGGRYLPFKQKFKESGFDLKEGINHQSTLHLSGGSSVISASDEYTNSLTGLSVCLDECFFQEQCNKKNQPLSPESGYGGSPCSDTQFSPYNDLIDSPKIQETEEKKLEYEYDILDQGLPILNICSEEYEGRLDDVSEIINSEIQQLPNSFSADQNLNFNDLATFLSGNHIQNSNKPIFQLESDISLADLDIVEASSKNPEVPLLLEKTRYSNDLLTPVLPTDENINAIQNMPNLFDQNINCNGLLTPVPADENINAFQLMPIPFDQNINCSGGLMPMQSEVQKCNSLERPLPCGQNKHSNELQKQLTLEQCCNIPLEMEQSASKPVENLAFDKNTYFNEVSLMNNFPTDNHCATFPSKQIINSKKLFRPSESKNINFSELCKPTFPLKNSKIKTATDFVCIQYSNRFRPILPKPPTRDAIPMESCLLKDSNISFKETLRKQLDQNLKEKFMKKIYDSHHEDKKKSIIFIENVESHRTNLHIAVIKEEVEKAFCLVAIHQQMQESGKESHNEINIMDNENKTALDYAVQKNTLLALYLMEAGARSFATIE